MLYVLLQLHVLLLLLLCEQCMVRLLLCQHLLL
jgi:hypothetical protein